MKRIAILGATGYTALELIKLLLRHSEASITVLTSRQEGQPGLASIHPQLAGRLDAVLENLTPAQIAQRADVAFSCLPHAASAETVMQCLELGMSVVDFSADYRLNDADAYEHWYGTRHPDARRLGSVPYGLPELFGDRIRGATLVANPGCFPTSAILALTPLLKSGLIEPAGLIIDSKTGVSGGGRTPKLGFHFPECNESISAYAVGSHRHTPEIDQVLAAASGQDVQVVFTPHLTPMDRGILSTCYATPAANVDQEQCMDCLRDFYRGKPFVRVVDHLPATKYTSHTNFCDIHVRHSRGKMIILSCLDNLIKGASGAAVQNFNWMFGFPETEALL